MSTFIILAGDGYVDGNFPSNRPMVTNYIECATEYTEFGANEMIDRLRRMGWTCSLVAITIADYLAISVVSASAN